MAFKEAFKISEYPRGALGESSWRPRCVLIQIKYYMKQ